MGCEMWPHSMWDLSSLLGIEPMSPLVEAQKLNHWTASEVPCFLLFSLLEFGTHCPVVMDSPQCPYIFQFIYPKSADVPICINRSVSVELITWKHTHILMDTVVTYVLMCIDLCVKTSRKTYIFLLCFTDNASSFLFFQQTEHL